VSVHDLSHRAVLIYDGDCAFCRHWVDKTRDVLPVFPKALTSQSISLDDYGLSVEDVTRYAWLITPTRHVAGGAIARTLLIHQPRFWLRLLGHLLSVWPFPFLADAVYRLVAKNRHRLPGSTAQCEVDQR
jgi:predicted DCC family thiol-disulfide oxidoreductase YuxK